MSSYGRESHCEALAIPPCDFNLYSPRTLPAIVEIRKLSNECDKNHYLVTIGTSITEDQRSNDECNSPHFKKAAGLNVLFD